MTLLDSLDALEEEEGTLLLYSGGSHEASKRSFLCSCPLERVTLFKNRLEKTCLKTLRSDIYPLKNPWDGLEEHLVLSNDKSRSDLPEWGGVLCYELGFYSDQSLLKEVDENTLLAEFYRYGKVVSSDAGESKKKAPSALPVFFDRSDFLRLDDYREKVEEILEEIRKGNVYQVNLTHTRTWEFSGKLSPLFCRLVEINPTPFSAYFRGSRFSLLSTSQERLIKKTHAHLETRPIKGTIRRGKNNEDERLANELIRSEKDISELLMITDLLRNDLGKISAPGSVNVDAFATLEAYENVFHLVSIISSVAKEACTPVQILKALFPGGSITGCPKLSAMQLIDRLEKRPRRTYTGSLGYITSTGDFDFNILIRTLERVENTLSLSVGGAIVIDSNSANEYQESLQKASSLLKAIEKDIKPYKCLS